MAGSGGAGAHAGGAAGTSPGSGGSAGATCLPTGSCLTGTEWSSLLCKCVPALPEPDAAGAGGAMFDAPVSYPCENPSLGAGQAGEGGASGASGAALSCVVGQTFCYVFVGLSVTPTANSVYIPECRSFSENAATDCATTPTCDCLCTHFACQTECRCNEVNGLPTVTCHQI